MKTGPNLILIPGNEIKKNSIAE